MAQLTPEQIGLTVVGIVTLLALVGVVLAMLWTGDLANKMAQDQAAASASNTKLQQQINTLLQLQHGGFSSDSLQDKQLAGRLEAHSAQLAALRAQGATLAAQDRAFSSQLVALGQQEGKLSSQLAALGQQDGIFSSQLAALRQQDAALVDQDRSFSSQFAALREQDKAFSGRLVDQGAALGSQFQKAIGQVGQRLDAIQGSLDNDQTLTQQWLLRLSGLTGAGPDAPRFGFAPGNDGISCTNYCNNLPGTTNGVILAAIPSINEWVGIASIPNTYPYNNGTCLCFEDPKYPPHTVTTNI